MSINNKTVSIIGCGWLGGQLLPHFSAAKRCFASARSPESLAKLAALGVEAVPLSLPLLSPVTAKQSELFNSDIILLLIPAGLRRDPQRYLHMMQTILTRLNPNATVLLASTTSVYLSEDKVIDEGAPIAQTQGAKAMRAVEEAVLAFKHGYVLRLAGLVGGQRNPGRFLAGKEAVPGKAHPVNLVNGADVVAAILALIEQLPSERLLNLCYPSHPTRQHYYTLQAEALGLTAPKFDEQDNSGNKIVDGRLITRVCGFDYQHPI